MGLEGTMLSEVSQGRYTKYSMILLILGKPKFEPEKPPSLSPNNLKDSGNRLPVARGGGRIITW